MFRGSPGARACDHRACARTRRLRTLRVLLISPYRSLTLAKPNLIYVLSLHATLTRNYILIYVFFFWKFVLVEHFFGDCVLFLWDFEGLWVNSTL